MMRNSNSVLRNGIINSVVCLASLVFILLGIELFCALFHPYKIVDDNNTTYHQLLGWVNMPNVSGRIQPWRFLPASVYRTHNSNGLRSTREISYDKPAGIKRIMLIGDSYFWGYGVNDQEVLSEVLQQMVGSNIEIINGAVTGYGTDQEFLWLVSEGMKYKPDLVICGMFPDNDLEDITTSILANRYPKPYYTLVGSGLKLHNVPVPDIQSLREKEFAAAKSGFKRLKKFLRHNLHTYQLIVGKLNTIPSLRKLFLKTGLADDTSMLYEQLPHYNLTDRAAIENLSDAILLEMNRVCEKNNALFLLCFIPVKEQTQHAPPLYDDYHGKDSDSLKSQNEENSVNSSYLHRFTENNNIAFLDFLPIVRKYHREGKALYYLGKEDFHWNALGHKVAAEAIRDYLWGPLTDPRH